MRTDFEFVLCGGRASRLAVAAEEARAEIETAERELSAFSLGSMLSRINREAGRRPVKAPGRLIELLQLCREVHRQSGGAFDPSVAPLMSAWGFRGAPAEDIAASLPAVGLDGLELDPVAGTVRFRRAGMELDLGGVGKGAALDRAAEALRELGVERALLHGGASTFLAVGAPPGPAAGRVGVRAPGHPARSLASIFGAGFSAPPAGAGDDLPADIETLEEAICRVLLGEESVRSIAREYDLDRRELQRLADRYQDAGRATLQR